MSISEQGRKFLAHYGVPGMKWGVRKEEESSGLSRGSSGQISSARKRGGTEIARRAGTDTRNRNAKIAGGIAGGAAGAALALPAARVVTRIGNIASQYSAFGGDNLQDFAQRKAFVTRTRQTGLRALGKILSQAGRAGMKVNDILSPALAKGGINAVRLMSKRTQALRFLAVAGVATAGTLAGIEIADDATEKDDD